MTNRSTRISRDTDDLVVDGKLTVHGTTRFYRFRAARHQPAENRPQLIPTRLRKCLMRSPVALPTNRATLALRHGPVGQTDLRGYPVRADLRAP